MELLATVMLTTTAAGYDWARVGANAALVAIVVALVLYVGGNDPSDPPMSGGT